MVPTLKTESVKIEIKNSELLSLGRMAEIFEDMVRNNPVPDQEIMRHAKMMIRDVNKILERAMGQVEFN